MKKMIFILGFIWCFLFVTFPATAKEKAKVIYNGDPDKPNIYLTFDDGYTVRNTKKILDVLKEENVSATFFVEGGFMHDNPDLCKRIDEEQILANHTYTHQNITQMSNAQFFKEIKQFEDEANKILGHPIKKYFRPPMGMMNKEKLEILNDYGYTVFMWNVQYYDYVHLDDQGEEYVIKQVLSQVKNGSIILMHTLTNSNADALKTKIGRAHV